MKLAWQLLTATAVAFLLVPALRADDTGKVVTTASKDEAVNSPLAPGALGEAVPAAPRPAPAPPARVGTRSGDTPRVELFGGY
jgi:hypothetical protein